MLAGEVLRVSYHNPDSGFAVLKVNARGHREPLTVVGRIAAIAAGETIRAAGRFVIDPAYGRQFTADFLESAPPASANGIERYLASGLIKGIGRGYAKKLIKAFGARVLDVIDREPERLRAIPGIGPKRADAILKAWREQRAIREIMLFLSQHGLGPGRAVRIFKTYGANALQVISRNPYQLSRDIRGIGFKISDGIAASLGIDRGAMVRRRAGIAHVLGEALEAGHCGLPREDLITSTADLLGLAASDVEAALRAELGSGQVVEAPCAGRPCIFLAAIHEAEREIARRLRRLAAGRPPWPPIDVARAIPWVEEKVGVRLADGQRAAIATALAAPAVVITGGPGVGKTTLLRSLLRILTAKQVTVALAAPTGRAAKRLAESSGLGARTLHRLLEVDAHRGLFRRNEDNPLPCDLLIVDEASMIDVPMMRAILRALPPGAALILVGDADQLPSVGPGQVLADIIAAGVLPVVRLTEVFRQAAESRIIANAHRIRVGTMPFLDDAPGSDFRFYATDDADAAAAIIRRLVVEELPARHGFDSRRDIQVLTPMNQGRLGARTLNADLQAALNPRPERAVERFGWRFAVGDKVMQVENDYAKDVFNGDLGIVVAIDEDDGTLLVDMDGRRVGYGFDELDQLTLAYATTIHKAQGSEYPAVVMPVTTQHYPMLQRSLIYTGLTRGRRFVAVVGEARALAIAVKGSRGGRRWSCLAEELAAIDSNGVRRGR